MASQGSWYRSPHLAVFGDACVLTAGAFAVCLAVGAGIVTLLQPSDGTVSAIVLAIAGPVFTFAGVIVGPLAAWRLHGKRLSGAAVIGAFFGIGATVVTVGAFVALLVTIARPIMGDEAPAALAVAGLFGAGLLAVMVVSVARAVRDITSSRDRVTLDTALLASAVAVALLVAVMVWLMVNEPGSEGLEALPFMLVFSLIGGMMTVGASMLDATVRPPSSDQTAASA